MSKKAAGNFLRRWLLRGAKFGTAAVVGPPLIEAGGKALQNYFENPEENTVPFDSSSNPTLDPGDFGYSDQTKDPRKENPFFRVDSDSASDSDSEDENNSPNSEENNGSSQNTRPELRRDSTSIFDKDSALAGLFDPEYVAQRDRENFKRLLIQNELSQRAGLAKSRERSRREIEKQRIASWQAVNQQSILRDQAMFQSAATSIAATNPSNALARLQSMALTDIGDIVPTRVIKSS